MTGPSIREQVLQAVVAALGEDGTPAKGVFRSRLDQLSQADLPAYDVSPGEEQVRDEGGYGDRGSVTRTLEVIVRAVMDATVQGDAAGQPETLPDDGGLDPFYLFAVAQLTGDGQNLGGLVNDMTEVRSRPVFRPGGRALIGLEMLFEVTFATRRGDPTQRG